MATDVWMAALVAARQSKTETSLPSENVTGSVRVTSEKASRLTPSPAMAWGMAIPGIRT